MTAAEKTSLARFLDLAACTLSDGYRVNEPEYQFLDDLPPGEQKAGVAAVIGGVAEVPATERLPASGADTLQRIAADVRACTGCSLCETRKNAVPGEGAPQPDVMVIGEGPGADEDASGRPFVGKAGQLLDKMLGSIGLSRESNCFIANVVKCRPPGNRDPSPEEAAACTSFLQRQITLLNPKIILCVGRIAVQKMLMTSDGIGKLRGRFINYDVGDREIPLIATYHPSALLRDESYKRPTWEDLKVLKAKLDELQ